MTSLLLPALPTMLAIFQILLFVGTVTGYSLGHSGGSSGSSYTGGSSYSGSSSYSSGSSFASASTSFQCPEHCECDALPSDSTSWAVYCLRGNINDTRFAQILSALPPNLRSLHIESSRWRPANKFKWNDNLNRFRNLKQLKLIGCGIPVMSRNIRLPSLELLDLSGNQLEHATMGNFAGLPQLKFLDLSDNRLNILPTGVFTFLKSLKSLKLANNGITELSTSLLRGLSTIDELSLDGNTIAVKQINDVLLDVPQLRRLSLSDCQLGSLSGGNFSGANLSGGNLSLQHLTHLAHLSLAGNDLRRVPVEIVQHLPELTHLNLANNSIGKVQACAFCSNIRLSRLDLSHNLLGIAPQPFHTDAFRNVELHDLDISYNHLNNFDSQSLGWAQTTITTLRISGNFVQGFNPEVTATLPKLRELHLADNSIDHIPLLLPPQFYHLTWLNLSSNNLADLPEDLNRLLPNLKELDLSANDFTKLTSSVMSNLDRIERVHLHENPWDCSCAVRNIQSHLQARYALRHQLHYDDTRCASPSLLAGQPLLLVTGVDDCAVLLGASYGISQSNELLLMFLVLIAVSTVLAIAAICIHLAQRHRHAGSYVTREHSRTPLTMTHQLSCSSSSAGEPLTPPLPPPPKSAANYFGI